MSTNEITAAKLTYTNAEENFLNEGMILHTATNGRQLIWGDEGYEAWAGNSRGYGFTATEAKANALRKAADLKNALAAE